LTVSEKADGNYSAYALDFSGCIATGGTREETEQNMYEAIKLHVAGLLEDRQAIPESEAVSEYMVVA
jgi:predicted RNase H-like HicB family nuclease